MQNFFYFVRKADTFILHLTFCILLLKTTTYRSLGP